MNQQNTSKIQLIFSVIYRIIATAPVKFQVGDIVEVQVSFAVLPLREGKMKTSMILRSITLLDRSQTQVGYSVMEMAEKSLIEDIRQLQC